MRTNYLSPAARAANPGVPTIFERSFCAVAIDSKGRRQSSIHATREDAEVAASNLTRWPWHSARVEETLEEYFDIK